APLASARAVSSRRSDDSREASQTATAGAGATASSSAISRSRRGSRAIAAASPTASASQAPREKVKYKVGRRTTRQAAAIARHERARAFTAKDAASSAPTAATSPSPFQ